MNQGQLHPLANNVVQATSASPVQPTRAAVVPATTLLPGQPAALDVLQVSATRVFLAAVFFCVGTKQMRLLAFVVRSCKCYQVTIAARLRRLNRKWVHHARFLMHAFCFGRLALIATSASTGATWSHTWE